MRSINIVAAFAAAFSLCLLAACGGSRDSLSRTGIGAQVKSPPIQGRITPVTPSASPAPFSLTAPAELLAQRDASFTLSDGYSDGADFEAGMPSNRVSPAGTTAGFIPAFGAGDSGLGKMAYAVYAFTLPDYNNDSPVAIQLNFSDVPEEGDCFMAWSDFDGGFWTWFSMPADGLLVLPGFTEYISPSDIHLLCVAVKGSNAAILDSIQLSTEQAPVASIVPDFDSGIAPLTVNFNGSASLDPEGSLTNYEWDLDGDGLFNETGAEQTAAGQTTAQETYAAPGSYDVTLRVTDAADLQDEATVQINVSASQPPVADLQANTSFGDKPLQVNFNATGSDDPDGTVVDYEWDFDGDNNFGESDNGEDSAQGDATPLTVTYSAVGVFNAAVRVSDNDGGKDTAVLPITVSNTPPLAMIQAGALEGNVPFTISFTAEMSTDPGGMITDYEWDFDADGLFNEVGTEEETARGVVAPSDIDFTSPGDFNVSVRVTDDDNATATASTVISAHGWKVVTVDDPDGNPGINYSDMVTLDSFPAIAYCVIGTSVRYGISSTLDGAEASDWTFVTVPGNSGTELSLAATVAGPAIATHIGGASFDLSYQLADGDGSSTGDWTAVVTPDTTGNTGRFPELRIVQGNPTITYWNSTDNKLMQIRSLDNRGDLIIDWLPATVIHDAAANENIFFLGTYDVLGGNPAVAYYFYDNPADYLRFRRSSDNLGDNGTDWTNFFDLETNNGSGSWQTYGFATMSGNPAMIYRSDPDNGLFFRTAQNAGGTAWNARVQITTGAEAGSHGSFSLIGGFPACAYQTAANGDLKYILSETVGGGAPADWDTVETIDNANFVGSYVKLLQVNGRPAVSYVDSTIAAMKYAIKY